jgi:hypothetical protein
MLCSNALKTLVAPLLRTGYLTAVVAATVALASPIFAHASEIRQSERAADTKNETVAVLPWIYENGTTGAIKTGKEFLESVLTKANMEIVPESRVTATWANGLERDSNEDRKMLPSPKELLKLGEKLGVDWVITGRARWHTKSIWIGFGPKTKSDCTVDILIVDVHKREVALDSKEVKMDSTAKEKGLNVAVTLFISPLGTMISGGPKTPHEQRAVQLATGKAIQPWLSARPHNKKIETDGNSKIE